MVGQLCAGSFLNIFSKIISIVPSGLLVFPLCRCNECCFVDIFHVMPANTFLFPKSFHRLSRAHYWTVFFPSSSTSVAPHKIQWRKKMACRLNGKRMKLRSWSDLECDANADVYNGRMARCISLVDQAATRTSGMLNATRIWKNQLKWM